ncbi:MAG: ABC-three component system protein [Planctomycetota bacterium]|jgi:uncharacterized protein YydD (DUF2326 family)
MIRSIYSSLESFKQLEFGPGLNILLADMTPDATVRQTRNRAGKTSAVEVIHFVTGSQCRARSLFRTDALVGHRFGLEFDVGETTVKAERIGGEPSKVWVEGQDLSSWPAQPSVSRDSEATYMATRTWKMLLGAVMFGLPYGDEDTEEPTTYAPTFRSLFPYFARRKSANGFSAPFYFSTKQQLWQQQIGLSYMLGLDWTIAQKWQLIRAREKTLKELKKAARGGALGSVIGTTADLRTKLAIAEDRCARLERSLLEYRVLPEYHDMEVEASRISRELGSLADDNMMDRERVASLEDAMVREEPPPTEDLEGLYREAGIVIPDRALRQFEDVRRFHVSVLENRRSYLEGETEDARTRIQDRDSRMQELDNRRAEIMGILQAHGALEGYAQLQTELGRVGSEAEAIRQRYRTAEHLESEKAELEIERGQLQRRLQQDYREQSQVRDSAILAFERISSSLYESAGSLSIGPSSNGPAFEITIQGDRSAGIGNMQVFSFDMTLVRILAERGQGPGFLVHDSHLFDGVDERQIASALEFGAAASTELGFQYIVTLNSDRLPDRRWFSEGFDVNAHVLATRLTDAAEDGGLFGIRF